MADTNILSSAALYAVHKPAGEMIGVFEDFQSTDKFLTERAANTPTGKLEMLKLSRLSIDAHELALLLMGRATISGDSGADVIVTPASWFAKPEFSSWYHKVPKITVSETTAKA